MLKVIGILINIKINNYHYIQGVIRNVRCVDIERKYFSYLNNSFVYFLLLCVIKLAFQNLTVCFVPTLFNMALL